MTTHAADMRVRRGLVRNATVAAVLAVFWIALDGTASGQEQGAAPRPAAKPPAPPPHSESRPWTGPRRSDGQPDVQGGLWFAVPATSNGVENPFQTNIDYAPAGGGRDIPSRVVDPPDGKIPYQPWALEKRNRQWTVDRDNPTRPEHVDTANRCIHVPPRAYYNQGAAFRVIQPQGSVVFLWEQFHLYRVVPVTPESEVLPGQNLKLWMGLSHGRWDGNTLVVQTTNINGKSRIDSNGDFLTDHARFTERFSFIDAETLVYEITIEDPTVYTRPWTMRVLQKHRKDEEPMEDACHEGMEVERSLFGHLGLSK